VKRLLYTDYKQSRDLSWRVLLQEGISALPVSTASLCRQMGVKVMAYDNTIQHNENGYTTCVDGLPYIFYNSAMIRGRARFTVAHELGHLLLGHVGKHMLVSREDFPGDNPIEQAANVFASRLLAPACVLWGCGVRSAEEIMRLCEISRAAAEFRMQRMDELYRRGRFLTSPLERRVFEQFQVFISQSRLR